MAASQTLVRKITIGTPIRKVSGAAAQRLDDLLDVQIRDLADGELLQYEASTERWKNVPFISGGSF